MIDVLAICYLTVVLVAVSDVMRLLKGDTERLLWVIAIVLVPVAGPAYWYYVQYGRLGAERRRRLQAPDSDRG